MRVVTFSESRPTTALPVGLRQLGRPLAWIRSRGFVSPPCGRFTLVQSLFFPPSDLPSPAILCPFISYIFCASLSISALSLSYPIAFPLHRLTPFSTAFRSRPAALCLASVLFSTFPWTIVPLRLLSVYLPFFSGLLACCLLLVCLSRRDVGGPFPDRPRPSRVSP